jgi:hypothetical protein
MNGGKDSCVRSGINGAENFTEPLKTKIPNTEPVWIRFSVEISSGMIRLSYLANL